MTVTAGHRIYVGKDIHKFSCAHMTVFPGGVKERLHGHNFQVEVALELQSIAFEQILDFGIVKAAVQRQCEQWTERLLLAANNPYFKIVRHDQLELEFLLCDKRYVVPADEVLLLEVDNIVVETLALAFANALVERLRAAVSLSVVDTLEVTVSESARQGGVARLDLRSAV